MDATVATIAFAAQIIDGNSTSNALFDLSSMCDQVIKCHGL